jgi:hypothetical protein
MQHKPRIDKNCLSFFDQRKQAKQWVKDPSQSNVDNLDNVRSEAAKVSINHKKAYMKANIEELGNNSKIKNIWDLYTAINDFKKGH